MGSSQLHIKTVPEAAQGAGPELPLSYGTTRLVLLARDPAWLHMYWELAPYTWADIERLYGPAARKSGRAVLRIFWDGQLSSPGEEVDVQLWARQCSLPVHSHAGRVQGHLGLVLPDGRFALLSASNEAWLPSGKVADRLDERWAALGPRWERLHEMSGGGRLGVVSSLSIHGPAWEMKGLPSSHRP
jgi:uncharacterized protein